MKTKFYLPKSFILLFLLTFGFSSCEKQKENPTYTIGFSQCIGSDLWRKTMLEEIKIELSLHPGAKLIYKEANGNSKLQVLQAQDMIRKGIDILIISPNEAQPLTPVVEQAYNKGIPVIIIDRKTASSAYTAYVGADNFQIGKMAGEYAGEVLKGKGNIVEVLGLPGSSPTIERQRGFIQGLKRYPDIKITNQVYGNWLGEDTKEQLNKIKNSLINIDAIFAHNDQMASASRKVINTLLDKKQIKVIGVDALPGQGGGLEMVSSGILTASVVYPTGGKEAISTAFKILNKESFSKENILQSLVIDSTNVELMKLQWNKFISQQKDIERQGSLLEEQKVLFKNQQIILNVTVIALVLSVVFGGLALYALLENRKINKNLETNNIEILNQRNQLIEMSSKAEAATEAKLNFFTNMSHEFRTPLTLILSPLEDLIQNEKIKAGAENNLNLIQKNVYRLLRLINQLIDYRKIEHDKMLLSVSQNNIVSFVTDILESFQHSAKKKNIEIRLLTDAQNIKVWLDVNMLDKVIFNLLSNALKFTPANGVIYVEITHTSTSVTLSIKDNGPGIPAEEIDHVFEHFYQAQTNTAKGSGLGLSLSKELMILHHGNINVESTKSQGTKFSIQLQLGEDHFTEQEKLRGKANKDLLYEDAKIYTTGLNDIPEYTNPDLLRTIKPQSILIIEDNADLLNYLGNKLEQDYEVFLANTGENGIASAYEQVPDLIISDLILPGLSGRSLTEKLKSDIRTSHIPIILLSAHGSLEQQINGMESMADAYIIKPFNYDYLVATVKSLLKNRYLLKSHYMSDISSSGKPPISKSLDKKFINDFSGIVEQNLSNENFSVDEISKEIGISRVQLYRKVKALLDCSVTDYIMSRRLKKAKYLLINERYSIAEITYMVGFSSPNYFSTVFKSKYGMRPSEFKKNNSQSKQS
ncbi:ABC-type sugar transport system, substrate-binding protein, contains N-terminal xre family HTH domain [Pedobacter antarcticus]|uniref:histidine kinase n=1 Tax=Pedobacter antarcticus TaxID=34086 RepID=A0A1I2FJJ6_9SPHI|nr:substrate-binding domain-containing protein [Pedobacter antarcticus]SFF05173.1 ABC-type sugar transport system, substrate-binding protein, contains N-terminal xre family HTH domain [Pedobacter antarcticus]